MKSSSSAGSPADSATAEPRAIEFGGPTATVRRAGRFGSRFGAPLDPAHLRLLPGLIVAGLTVFWSAHGGGYSAPTWYWGALLSLATLGWSAGVDPHAARSHSGAVRTALVLFGLYVAWSYLSILWSESPGDALDGANRALMYLVLFSVMVRLPWTPRRALVLLTLLTAALGVLAVVTLTQLSTVGDPGTMISIGRLQAPVGYFNGTVALFMVGALLSLGLAAEPALPRPVRAVLVGLCAACLQLVVLGQSRGWLFTLPLVLVVALWLLRHRIRATLLAILPAAGTSAALGRLFAVFRNRTSSTGLLHAAHRAGEVGLLVSAAVALAGALLLLAERRLEPKAPSLGVQRRLGAGLATVAVAVAVAGAVAGTGGHPLRFISRQWNGFSHPTPLAGAGSYFDVVGSGRYDFWRVGINAFVAHPLGGLGQDNFADYYVSHRRTYEEPAWVHSLWLRLLTHTGIVGFVLFGGFLIAALAAAARARRSQQRSRAAVAGIALLPLTVWLIHGSIDWFWEVPALSGLALGWLGVACALAEPRPGAPRPPGKPLSRRFAPPLPRLPASLGFAGSVLALCAAAAVLAFPFLAQTEIATAARTAARSPDAAVARLRTAAELDPLSSLPDRLAGTILLQTGEYARASTFFRSAVARQPDGWFSWLGAGLAASALGRRAPARHDLIKAASINNRQPGVVDALAAVDTPHPLTPAQALARLVLAH